MARVLFSAKPSGVYSARTRSYAPRSVSRTWRSCSPPAVIASGRGCATRREPPLADVVLEGFHIVCAGSILTGMTLRGARHALVRRKAHTRELARAVRALRLDPGRGRALRHASAERRAVIVAYLAGWMFLPVASFELFGFF